MAKAENNVAAQAGDEPMPVAWAVFAKNGNVRIWFGDKATADRWKAANELAGELVPLAPVSPRATADVERDAARYRWLVEYANDPGGTKVQPVQDWVRGWNIDKVYLDAAIDAAIATTKPGA